MIEESLEGWRVGVYVGVCVVCRMWFGGGVFCHCGVVWCGCSCLFVIILCVIVSTTRTHTTSSTSIRQCTSTVYTHPSPCFDPALLSSHLVRPLVDSCAPSGIVMSKHPRRGKPEERCFWLLDVSARQLTYGT